MGWRDTPVVGQPAPQESQGQPAWMSAPLVGQDPAPTSSPGMSGLAGVYRGIAGAAGMPVDTLLNVADLGMAAYGTGATLLGRPDLAPSPIDRRSVWGSGEQLSDLVSRGGINTTPQGNTAADRYAFAGGVGAASAAFSPQSAVGTGLRGVAGGLAGQGALDATGSPAAAAAASLVAGGAPEFARGATARIVRGGDRGAEAMRNNIAAFDAAGASPSIGQATQNRGWRAIESILSKIPGGAGQFARFSKQQQRDIGAGADRIADSVGRSASATRAGMGISSGVTDSFLPQAKRTQQKLYADFDRQVPSASNVPVTNTIAALDSIASGIPNASAVSSSRLMRNNMAADLLQAVRADAPYGALPYEALQAMRTRIGEKLNDFELAPDVSRQQLKKVYAALTEDMKVAAAINGPKASAAFERANKYTRVMHERMDILERVIDKAGGPEKVFGAAMSGTGEGATTLRAVMKSIPLEQRGVLTSSIIRRLGRATPGRQNDVGDEFSTETFLTNWSRLSPEAKTTIVGPFGPEFRRGVDALASVASNLRDGSQVFRNSSNTASTQGAITATAGFVGSASAGQWPVAMGIGGSVAAANAAARLMTNPAFVRALSETTRLPPDILISQITNISNQAAQGRR